MNNFVQRLLKAGLCPPDRKIHSVPHRTITLPVRTGMFITRFLPSRGRNQQPADGKEHVVSFHFFQLGLNQPDGFLLIEEREVVLVLCGKRYVQVSVLEICSETAVENAHAYPLIGTEFL